MWISLGSSSFNSSVLNVNIITDKEARSGRRGSQLEGTVLRALASHICNLGLNPSVDTVCGLRLLLVLFSAPRGFLHDLQFSTLQFDLESEIPWKPKGLSVLRTVKCQPSFLKKTIFRRQSVKYHIVYPWILTFLTSESPSDIIYSDRSNEIFSGVLLQLMMLFISQGILSYFCLCKGKFYSRTDKEQ